MGLGSMWAQWGSGGRARAGVRGAGVPPGGVLGSRGGAAGGRGEERGGGEWGEGFGEGRAPGGGGVGRCQRRAFAHGKGRAGIAFEGVGGQGYVGQRHLVGADQLIAGAGAGDGAIGDGEIGRAHVCTPVTH